MGSEGRGEKESEGRGREGEGREGGLEETERRSSLASEFPGRGNRRERDAPLLFLRQLSPNLQSGTQKSSFFYPFSPPSKISDAEEEADGAS